MKILYITFTDVINLYKKFQMIISEIVPSKSLKSEEDKMLDRQILKSITDAVFMKLSVGKYKENCHSQSVYSFIQDNSLDNIARKMGMKQSNCKRTSAEIQHFMTFPFLFCGFYHYFSVWRCSNLFNLTFIHWFSVVFRCNYYF